MMTTGKPLRTLALALAGAGKTTKLGAAPQLDPSEAVTGAAGAHRSIDLLHCLSQDLKSRCDIPAGH